MKTLLFSLLLLAMTVMALSAADVSGKWSGTLEATSPEGESKSDPVYMILKQEGNMLTGSGGPNAGEQHPIQNGKVDGNRLTFEIPRGQRALSFDLKVTGDEIQGEIKGTKKDGTPQTAKLTLKRVKSD